MESRLHDLQGQTFSSSLRGLHFARMNAGIVLSSLLGILITLDCIDGYEVGWRDLLFYPIVLYLGVRFMRSGLARKVLRSCVTIRPDGLTAENTKDSAELSWRDIARIYVHRSTSGDRCKFYVESRRGRLFTLLDPVDGELLEAWAIAVAQTAGVRVELGKRFYLNREPVWTFLACCAAHSALLGLKYLVDYMLV